jgi:transposase
MSAPTSMPIRKAVISMTGKMEIEEIAAHLNIGSATVKRIRKQYRETGTLEPKKPVKVGRNPLIDERGDEVLRVLVVERSDATLEEFAALFELRTGEKVSDSTISRAFQRLGITRKKNDTGRRASRGAHQSAERDLLRVAEIQRQPATRLHR